MTKNSVGTKQLKKNAVTTAKIKKEAVTAAKVKKGTLTGAQINVSTLGTVPTAQLANSLAAPENWHAVGAAGEPGFENGWKNTPSPPSPFEPAGFYKDQGGVVHLRGIVTEGTVSQPIFRLPPGYRPATGNAIAVTSLCAGGCTGQAGIILIFGSGTGALEDAVVPIGAGTTRGLDNITFRAEG